MVHEYFCTHVNRDMSKCFNYFRVDNRNSFQAPQIARLAGWNIGMAMDKCPDHAPIEGPKVK